MAEKVEIGPCTLYRGDCLEILPTLPVADAVITDPPYASGGMYRADRCAAPSKKYEQHGTKNSRGDFSHDAKDQRSWMSWCNAWMARLPLRNGSYVLSFIDWRQLPAITDAMQWSGLMWRGVAAWDKGPASRAPHKGYLRHQCEFIAWGTSGACAIAEHAGPFPGCYSVPVLQRDKHHPAGKPTPLLAELSKIVPAGSLVLDPFMGSGTAGVAAIQTGRRFIGIECDAAHFDTACRRIEEE